jgi:signal transduction histidine kinase/ligand-binding sensor domain-containing protein
MCDILKSTATQIRPTEEQAVPLRVARKSVPSMAITREQLARWTAPSRISMLSKLHSLVLRCGIALRPLPRHRVLQRLFKAGLGCAVHHLGLCNREACVRSRATQPSRSGWFALALLLPTVLLPRQELLAEPVRSGGLQVGEEVWTAQEGAPEGVVALAQTADGFLWLGGPGGLVRFDGERFEPFRPSSGDKLLSTYISSLFAPRTGGLWVGYLYGGFSFIKNGRVRNFDGALAASTGTVYEFVQDESGTLWATTISGLWRFDHSHWQRLGVEQNVPAAVAYSELALDPQGGVWVLHDINYLTSELLYKAPGAERFQAVATDLYGPYFVRNADGIAIMEPFRERRVGQEPPAPQERPILATDALVFVDRNHSIWIHGDPRWGMMRRLQPFEKLPTDLSIPAAGEDDYPLHAVSSVAYLVDREGDIWVAQANAVYRFFYRPLIRVDFHASNGGQAGPAVVSAGDDGAVWLALSTELQLFSHGATFVLPKPFGPLHGARAPVWLECAFVDSHNTLWVAFASGLWHFSDGTWKQIKLPPGMARMFPHAQAMTEDRSGGLWLSFGRYGLFRLADGHWIAYGGYNNLPKIGVVSEFTDPLGREWFGYVDNVLAMLDGDRVQVFGAKQGVEIGNITAIEERGDAMWIGGEFGLERLGSGRFRMVKAVDDEWLRGISGIVQTANGDLWLNGISGIVHIPAREIAEALRNPSHRIAAQHFGPRQGAPGIPNQLKPLPSAVEASDGRLWFSGSDGAAWLDPASAGKVAFHPRITLESVTADGRFYPPGLPARFPPHTAEVQFSYAAVSLSDPAAIRYRYQLDPLDARWHETREAQSVSYRNLAPGTYRFRVSATDTDGAWSHGEAMATFTILPAFYQTDWFYALCALTVFAILWTFYRVRMRQARSHIRARLEERLIERERIARDLHDTLLQGIQGLILRFQVASDRIPQGEPARDLMERALERADQVLEESRSRVKDLRVPLGGEGDLSVALAETARPLSEAQSVPYSVTVTGAPRALHPIVREETYLIGSEAITNAYRHARASKIEIQLAYEDGMFLLSVRDDGQGIEGGVLDAGGRPEHWGIVGMRERARRIRGQLTIRSDSRVGTEVHLRLPAEMAYAQAGGTILTWWRRRLSGARRTTPLG